MKKNKITTIKIIAKDELTAYYLFCDLMEKVQKEISEGFAFPEPKIKKCPSQLFFKGEK